MKRQINNVQRHLSAFPIGMCVILLIAFYWVAMKPLIGSGYRLDAEVFYVAGYALAHGVSPYDMASANQQWLSALGKVYQPGQIFAYPPTTLPFLWLLGKVPSHWAFRLIDIINIGAMLATMIVIAKFILRFRPNASANTILTSTTLALSPAAISIDFYYGQSSLFIFAGLLWGIYLLDTKYKAIAYIFFAIFATAKPQITLVPAIAAFILYANLKDWLLAGITLLIWIFTVFLLFGIQEFSLFLATMKFYNSYGVNSIDKMSGLARLLSKFQFEISQTASILISGVSIASLLIFLFQGKDQNSKHYFLENHPQLLLCTIFVINEFCVTLHDWDQSILAFPLAMMIHIKSPIRYILFIPLISAARPNIVIALLGGGLNSLDVTSIALGVAVLILITIILLSYKWRNETTK